MAVTIKEVDNIATLARLHFSEKEKEDLMNIMNNILDYFNKLSELDTENVEPLTHILPVRNVMRDDEVKETLDRDTVLANAPKHYRGHFVIPKVID